MSEIKKKKVVYYRDSDGNFVPSSSTGGDMLASKYDTDLDGIVNQADKVTNSLTIKDGSNTYTYDGSEAVEINVVGGGGTSEATSKNVFIGTQAEFDALSEDDQNAVEMFVCTDGDGETDSYATKAALNELIDGSTPVGDSAKLGGKSAESYIQSNPNLLVNGDFKLNTSGLTSYRSTSASIWTVDKWQIPANCTVEVINNGIKYTNNAVSNGLKQYIDSSMFPQLAGKTITLSFNVEGIDGVQVRAFLHINGVTVAYGKYVESGITKLTYTLPSEITTMYVGIIINTATSSAYVYNGKLELGSVATPFVPTNSYDEYMKIYGTQHLSNPNLLINGDFRINQRGLTEYTTTAAYSCDCWYMTVSGTTLTRGDKVVTITAPSEYTGYLYQYIEDTEALVGKTITTSIQLADDTIYSCTGTVPTSITKDTIISKVTTPFGDITVAWIKDKYIRVVISVYASNSVTLKYVKTELGSVATPLSPRPYGEELALCQRYLFMGTINTVNIDTAHIVYLDSNQISFFVPTPIAMRDKPTLFGTANSDYMVQTLAGATQTGFAFVCGVVENGIFVVATKTSHGLTANNCRLRVARHYAGFSAEL